MNIHIEIPDGYPLYAFVSESTVYGVWMLFAFGYVMVHYLWGRKWLTLLSQS